MESIEPSEECYSEIRTFLDTFQITAIEAQIIYEVANYRQHHMDLDMLSRKIPKEFEPFNVEKLVRKLISSGFLEPYAKKEVPCVRCAAWGRDVANLIRDRCYSKKLKYFGILSEKYADRKYHLCFDPQGFKEGEKRQARGPEGEEVAILVKKKSRADRIFRHTENGEPVYEIKIEAEVIGCPKCSGTITIESCYNPVSCYQQYNQVHCSKCGFEFMMRFALDKFYY